jgi:hypothetical protein
VIAPTGLGSSITHRNGPGERVHEDTHAEIRLNPRQPLKFVSPEVSERSASDR